MLVATKNTLQVGDSLKVQWLEPKGFYCQGLGFNLLSGNEDPTNYMPAFQKKTNKIPLQVDT